jgi:signal transduction histidine kinase
MDFFKTNAFRLAALYFVLFAASVVALLAFIYLSTAGFVEQQTEATLDAEITGLAEQYNQRGLSGLVQVIAERSAGERGDAMLYLVTDPLYHPLAGNLSEWPHQAQQIRPGWLAFEAELKRDGTAARHLARGTTFVLPGGFHLLVGRDLRDANAFRERVAGTLAWACVLTLALGLAGGLLMSRNMLRRVDAMNRTSAHIIHGDLSQRVPVTGTGDEFDQLAANLNEMLDQIERLMTGMRRVTDNIAHDLRTPLARLRARLEVSLLGEGDAARYAETLRETIAEADRLLATFNALLNIAETESGASRDPPAELDLAEVARSAGELYEPIAEEKGLRLVCRADQPVPVQGNRHLLSQAAANLIDNAIKYTPPGGTVEVRAGASGREAVLEVADSGPGIPGAEREAVLEPFVRLESSRSTPGNGLGLSLVRAVAKRHGGRLELGDNEPGLRARLALPLRLAQTATARGAVAAATA